MVHKMGGISISDTHFSSGLFSLCTLDERKAVTVEEETTKSSQLLAGMAAGMRWGKIIRSWYVTSAAPGRSSGGRC